MIYRGGIPLGDTACIYALNASNQYFKKLEQLFSLNYDDNTYTSLDFYCANNQVYLRFKNSSEKDCEISYKFYGLN